MRSTIVFLPLCALAGLASVIALCARCLAVMSGDVSNVAADLVKWSEK